jgi:hypothetical protein
MRSVIHNKGVHFVGPLAPLEASNATPLRFVTRDGETVTITPFMRPAARYLTLETNGKSVTMPASRFVMTFLSQHLGVAVVAATISRAWCALEQRGLPSSPSTQVHTPRPAQRRRGELGVNMTVNLTAEVHSPLPTGFHNPLEMDTVTLERAIISARLDRFDGTEAMQRDTETWLEIAEAELERRGHSTQRQHLEQFGTASNDSLFSTLKGDLTQSNNSTGLEPRVG